MYFMKAFGTVFYEQDVLVLCLINKTIWHCVQQCICVNGTKVCDPGLEVSNEW